MMAAPREILADTAHRPWELPAGPWVMKQVWLDLLFLHWPISAAALRPAIPAALEIDTFAGDAWIAVVPFRMNGIRLARTPALPWLSAFCELNVRTYVVADGKPGVWFFSLDAANPIAVAIARRWYHLPYFRARMALEERADLIRYRSERRHGGAPPASFMGSYRSTGRLAAAPPGSLEHFLTERYALYAADSRARVYRGEIQHRPWPLEHAEAEIVRDTTLAAAGMTPADVPPLAHFARRLDVLAWGVVPL